MGKPIERYNPNNVPLKAWERDSVEQELWDHYDKLDHYISLTHICEEEGRDFEEECRTFFENLKENGGRAPFSANRKTANRDFHNLYNDYEEQYRMELDKYEDHLEFEKDYLRTVREWDGDADNPWERSVFKDECQKYGIKEGIVKINTGMIAKDE